GGLAAGGAASGDDRSCPHRRHRCRPDGGRVAQGCRAPAAGRTAFGSRHRLGRTAGGGRGGRVWPPPAALSARSPRPTPRLGAPAPAMIALVRRLLGRGTPIVSDAGPRDAGNFAELHGASFHRGWSEDELEQLLADHSVVAHRAVRGGTLIGLILSRIAADE